MNVKRSDARCAPALTQIRNRTLTARLGSVRLGSVLGQVSVIQRGSVHIPAREQRLTPAVRQP